MANRSCMVTRVSTVQRRIARADTADDSARKATIGQVITATTELQEDDDGETASSLDTWMQPKKHKRLAKLLLACVLCLCLLSLVALLLFFESLEVGGLSAWRLSLMVNVVLQTGVFFTYAIVVVSHILKRLTNNGNVFYLMHNLKTPIRNLLWCTTCFVCWYALFRDLNNLGDRSARLASNIINCVEMSTVLLAANSIAIKILANSFHASAYFDRIRRSISNQLILEKLSVPYYDIPLGGETDVESLRAPSKSDDSILPKNASFNVLLNVARKRRKLSDCPDHASTRLYARDVFNNIVPDPEMLCFDRTHLQRFFAGCEQHLHAFMEESFDGADQVSLETFEDFVLQLNDEIVLLKLALSDKKTAINSISQGTHLVTLLACAFLSCVIVFRLNVTKIMLLTGSWVVASVVIFAPTLRDLIDDVIFVFLQHSYDVGDWIVMRGEEYLVDSVSILSTTFLYKRRITTISNKVLAQTTITNNSRKNVIERFDFRVSEILEIGDDITAFLRQNISKWEPNSLSVSLHNCTTCPCVNMVFTVDSKYSIENKEKNSNRLFKFLHELTLPFRCGHTFQALIS